MFSQNLKFWNWRSHAKSIVHFLHSIFITWDYTVYTQRFIQYTPHTVCNKIKHLQKQEASTSLISVYFLYKRQVPDILFAKSCNYYCMPTQPKWQIALLIHKNSPHKCLYTLVSPHNALLTLYKIYTKRKSCDIFPDKIKIFDGIFSSTIKIYLK